MSILGIGTDIVDKSRIAKLYQRFPKRLIERILSKEEQEAMPLGGIDYLAKRFAGKEAVAKALGTGMGRQLKLSQNALYRRFIF